MTAEVEEGEEGEEGEEEEYYIPPVRARRVKPTKPGARDYTIDEILDYLAKAAKYFTATKDLAEEAISEASRTQQRAQNLKRELEEAKEILYNWKDKL